MGPCCSATPKHHPSVHNKNYKERRSNVQEANPENSVIMEDKPKFRSRNPAEHFIITGDIVSLQKLIDDGELHINELTFDGGSKTPLHFAVQNPHRAVVELLIANGADVNIPELNTGNSAIFMAAIDYKVEYVEMLLRSSKLNIGLNNNNNKDIVEFLDDFKNLKSQRISAEDKGKLDLIIRRISEAVERNRNVEVLDEPSRF
jgi:ankyrin repeat protein